VTRYGPFFDTTTFGSVVDFDMLHLPGCAQERPWTLSLNPPGRIDKGGGRRAG